MSEPFKSTTQNVSLEDSRFTDDEIEDIRWIEETYAVVWDSHAVEFVRYDLRTNEFETCTVVSGMGPDMEEVKYRFRDRLGDFEDPYSTEWTLNGEYMLNIDKLRKLAEYPPETLTADEYVRIYEVPSGIGPMGEVLFDGIDRGLDWS